MGFTLLRELRKKNNMTQAELGKQIGVKPCAISRYENGSLNPPLQKIQAIAKVFDIDYVLLINSLTENPFVVNIDSNSQKDYKHLNRYFDALGDIGIRTSLYMRRLIVGAAHGKCELCQNPAPFNDPDGRPYLKVYAIDEEKQAEDDIKNLIALCPNCFERIMVLNDPKDIKKMKTIAQTHNF